MNPPLRVLHLEDNQNYSALVRAQLAAEGFNPEVLCVETREDFAAALEKGGFDLIIADYFLPTYDGIRAVKLAQEKTPETPILLVSGTIGEEAAVESLKAGATDYVLKHWPERLVPAVRRALREAEEHRSRLQAETALIRRERYFQALSENALDVVTILDREALFTYNSLSMTRVLGYKPEELTGQNAFSLVHPDDLAAAQEKFQHTIEHPESTVIHEFRVRHHDGSWRYLETICRSLLHDPEIAGIVINSRDISERRRAEEALRASELRLHSVWENSVDGMRLTDADGIIIAVNEPYCKLVAMDRAELEGNPFTVVQPVEEDHTPILASYRQSFRERNIERHIQCRVTFRFGKTVELEGACSFIELRDRNPLLLGLFRDVTEQKRLEEQLRQSQKMEAIGQLAGGVAHDFNNILTVIQGHASLLRSSGDLTGHALASAEQISQAAERAAGLTRQLLTFSRRQMMQPRQLDLNVVVSNMTRMMGRILGEDISLQFNYSPNVPLFHADAGMIEQVLLNLSVNSRDAMPAGGQLTIRISVLNIAGEDLREHPGGRAGHFVCLSVTDTGIGIPAKDLPRIFEPFFTTKAIGKGTGLGLATVYGIMKQHQGWIEVASKEGAGTTFQVFFPGSDGATELTGDTTIEQAVRGGTETILVVEDELPVRDLVCKILTAYGYQVMEAATGAAALEVWRDHHAKIDLLLTDIVMPDGMTGRDLAETLKAKRPGLKAIFTSSYSSEIVGKDFILQEGINFLQKPYHPQKLARAVRKCLDEK